MAPNNAATLQVSDDQSSPMATVKAVEPATQAPTNSAMPVQLSAIASVTPAPWHIAITNTLSDSRRGKL
jgi:hypothetical protein